MFHICFRQRNAQINGPQVSAYIWFKKKRQERNKNI